MIRQSLQVSIFTAFLFTISTPSYASEVNNREKNEDAEPKTSIEEDYQNFLSLGRYSRVRSIYHNYRPTGRYSVSRARKPKSRNYQIHKKSSSNSGFATINRRRGFGRSGSSATYSSRGLQSKSFATLGATN